MIPLFDLHCDTLSTAYEKNYSLLASPLHISFDKCTNYSPYTQVMAIWTNDKLSDAKGFERYLNVIQYSKSQGLHFITKGKDLSNFSLFLSIEDLRIIEYDISRIDILYQDGVRVITPVWKGTSAIGGAWDTKLGLSRFGKKAVSYFTSLGIIPDVSHASEHTFYDILEICEANGIVPIATHSNSYSVCHHKRNLNDSQFMELVKLGTVVGISLCPSHLSDFSCASINDIIRHIDAYLSLGGENCIALGCDFDGVDSLPVEINNISNLEKLYFTLINYYGTKIAEKIFRRNSCDLFKRIFL